MFFCILILVNDGLRCEIVNNYNYSHYFITLNQLKALNKLRLEAEEITLSFKKIADDQNEPDTWFDQHAESSFKAEMKAIEKKITHYQQLNDNKEVERWKEIGKQLEQMFITERALMKKERSVGDIL